MTRCSDPQAAYYLDIAALVDLTSQALVDILAMPKGVSLFSTIGLVCHAEPRGARGTRRIGVRIFSHLGPRVAKQGEVAVSAGPPPIVAARAVETASASVASKTEEAGVAERAARGGYVPGEPRPAGLRHSARPVSLWTAVTPTMFHLKTTGRWMSSWSISTAATAARRKSKAHSARLRLAAFSPRCRAPLTRRLCFNRKRKRRKGKARLSEDDGDAGAIPMSDPRLAENDGGGPATSELSADAHEEAEQQTHAEEEAAVVPEAAEVAAAAPGVLDAKGDAPLQSPGLRPAAAAVPRSTAHAQASLGGDGRFARVQPNPSVAMDLAQQLAAPLEEVGMARSELLLRARLSSHPALFPRV